MKLMQVWIVCFAVFFVAAEFYQWIQDISLPMPVFVIAGALLAVASNAQLFLSKQNSLQPVQTPAPPDASKSAAPVPNPEALPLPAPSSPRYYPGVQLPDLTSQSARSTSFSMQKSKPVDETKDLKKK